MRYQANTARTNGGDDPESPIGSSPRGLILAFAFYAVGVIHFALIPRTGGITSLFWDPFLYELFLSRIFLVIIYIPLIQLPLAVVYSVRSQGAVTHRSVALHPRSIFSIFILIAFFRGALLAAEISYPWEAGNLQRVVDYILFEPVAATLSIPTFVELIYLAYFPLVLLLLFVYYYRRRDGVRSPPLASTASEPADGEPAGAGASFIQRGDTPRSVSVDVSGHSPRQLPFWIVVAGVVIIILLGLALGGLSSAIGIASLLLTIYEMQPQ